MDGSRIAGLYTEFVAQIRKRLRGDRDQQTRLRHAAKDALDWIQIKQAATKAWNRLWEELLHARGSGARETALLLGRTRARLTLKELGSPTGGLHHNAVRRFSLRLQKDRPLQRRLALVEKELSRISALSKRVIHSGLRCPISALPSRP